MGEIKLFPWAKEMYDIINKVFPGNIDILSTVGADGFHIDSKYISIPENMIMALIDKGYCIDTDSSYEDVVRVYGNDEETRGLAFTFNPSEIEYFDTICVIHFFDVDF